MRAKGEAMIKQVLDAGYHYIEDGKAKPFLDREGVPCIGPLNGKGGRLPEGSEPVYFELDTANADEWRNSAGERLVYHKPTITDFNLFDFGEVVKEPHGLSGTVTSST